MTEVEMIVMKNDHEEYNVHNNIIWVLLTFRQLNCLHTKDDDDDNLTVVLQFALYHKTTPMTFFAYANFMPVNVKTVEKITENVQF